MGTKGILLVAGFCIISLLSFGQVRIVNSSANPAAVNSSAFIDASSDMSNNSSSNLGKGLLFPQVDLTNFMGFGGEPIGLPNSYPTYYDGMIVYNTVIGTAGIGGTSVSPGFYYYSNQSTTADGGKWIRMNDSNISSTPSGTSFPVVPIPKAGDIFYNTNDKKFYYYNDAGWVSVTGTPAGSTAPGTPAAGDIWYDTSTSPGTLKIYDGAGNGWIAIGETVNVDATLTGDGTSARPLGVANNSISSLNLKGPSGAALNFTSTSGYVLKSLGDGTFDWMDLSQGVSVNSNNISLSNGSFLVGNSSGKAAETAKGSITMAGFGATTSAEFAGVVSDETGSGKLVFDNSPSFTTPNLGAASATSLTATGSLTGNQFVSTVANGTAPLTVTSTTPVPNLSIEGNAATATNIGGGAAGDLLYQSAANTTAKLSAGSGGDVLTFDQGAPKWASATDLKASLSLDHVENTALSTWTGSTNLTTIGDNSVSASKLQGNGSALGNGSSGNVLQSLGNGKFGWLDISSGITADPSSLTLPEGNFYIGNSSGKAQATAKGSITLAGFGATTSAELAGVVSDETGSGKLVFDNSPSFTTPNLGAASATSLTATGNMSLGGTAVVSGGSLTLGDLNNAVTITAPTSNSGAFTLHLPAADGTANQVLKTDGFGNLGWANASSGSVTSISGTSNRISVGGTETAPVVDIDANYVGQTSIITLGTIGTGAWQGSAIGVAYGGTGLTSTTKDYLLYSSNNNTIGQLGTNTAGILVTNSSGTPSFSNTVNSALTIPKVTLSNTSNQLVFSGNGGTSGTLTWTPGTTNKTITLPDASGTVMLVPSGTSAEAWVLGGNAPTSGSEPYIFGTTNNKAVSFRTGTGNLNIGDDATAQNVNIGTGAGVKTVTLGSSNSTSTTTLLSGSGGLKLNVDNNQPINIGTGTSTGTVTIGGISTQTIALGSGAGIKTVTLGSSNSTSTTTLLSGSGGLNLNVNNAQPTNINTTAGGTVTLGTSSSVVDVKGALQWSGSTSGYVQFKAPASPAGYTLTLPVSAPINGSSLVTDATGTLTWGSDVVAQSGSSSGQTLRWDNTSSMWKVSSFLKDDGTDVIVTNNLRLFTGNMITFGNGETINNTTDGTIAITAPTAVTTSNNLTVGGDLTVTGNDITFGNAETISNGTDGTIAITAPTAVTTSNNLTVGGDLMVTGNDISTNTVAAATVFNTAATSVSIGGAASTISLGSGTSATTVNNDLKVKGSLAINPLGTAANSKAVIDMSGVNNKGILIPSMTYVQRTSLSLSAAEKGLMVFQTDDHAGTPAEPSGFYYYNGTSWAGIGGGGGGGFATTTLSAAATITQNNNNVTFTTGTGKFIMDGNMESKGAVYGKVRTYGGVDTGFSLSSDDYIIIILPSTTAAGGANLLIALPDPAVNQGRMIFVRNAHATKVINYTGYPVAGTNSLPTGKGHALVSDGTNWYAIAG